MNLKHMSDQKIKIACISDIHGHLSKDIPKCDILIIAGDILPLDIQRDSLRSISWFLLDFKPWTDSLSCDKVIFIPGNHDFLFEEIGPDSNRAPSEVMKKLLGNHKSKSKLVYLCDNSYKYKGRIFYGTPWIPELKQWAFYKDHEGLTEKFKNIPKKLDVLITHCPPSIGLAGTVLQQNWNYMCNFGSVELSEAIMMRDIKWSISGHIHSGLHRPEYIYNTNIVNVSLKNEDYKVDYEPFTFEL